MSDKQTKGNLADSIAMLEQILEVMPQDIEVLKALYNAYLNGGHTERAFEYLNQLIVSAMGGDDAEKLLYIGQELPNFEEAYPSEVAAQIARLRTLAKLEPAAPKKAAPRSVEDGALVGAKTEIDISEELALAWRLYEENQLSQEEYSSVLHDLTEVSSKEVDVPVSVLHVLNDRGFNQMNRIMNYLSNRSGVPCLMLADFELDEKVAMVLPEATYVHDGALPFAFFGNDLLVAVLNPFNNNLVDKVENESGHRCHTYLVAPGDYDAALGRLRALAQAA